MENYNDNYINKKNLDRIEKMKKIGVAATVAIVGLGLPAIMTPSALAYEDTMHSLTTMDLAYQQTETGFKVTINTKDFTTIQNSGINLEAYMNEEFYIMIDEVFVDMSSLFSTYGTTSFDIHIDKIADGFKYYLTTSVNGQDVKIDQIEGSSFIGQVTRDYLNTNINSKLHHKDIQVQQMNYDGDLFVVFEEQGDYSLKPIENAQSEPNYTLEEDGDIISIIPKNKESVQSVSEYSESDVLTVYDTKTGSSLDDGGKKDTSGREDDIIQVDDTMIVNALNDKTTKDLNIEEFARKEKQHEMSKKTEDTVKLDIKDTVSNTTNTVVQDVKQVSIESQSKDTVQNDIIQVKQEQTVSKTNSFSDIEGVYSQDAINNLVSKGVIEAKSSMFNPHQNISREQFAVMVANALDLNSTSQVVFNDMQGSVYASKIQGLYEAGIFLGSYGDFNPSDSLSRQQASAVLARTLEYKGYDTTTLDATPVFKDSSAIALYAKESVGLLQKLDIVHGKPDGTFDPYGQLTNAQIAKMLDKILGIVG